jgi:Tol biopolymer transport system component
MVLVQADRRTLPCGVFCDRVMRSTRHRVLCLLTLVIIAVSPLALPPGARAAYAGGDGLIAFSSASGAQSVLAVTPSGRRLRPLTTCRPDLDQPCGGTEPAWSPDGRRIAFRRGDELWVMNADGSAARPLDGVAGGEPSWSPDGRRIAFTALGYKGKFGLAIVKADGSSGRTQIGRAHV